MIDFLKTKEVADKFNVNIATVYGMAKKKVLPHVRIGNRYRFSKDGVEEYLAAHTVHAEPAVAHTESVKVD